MSREYFVSNPAMPFSDAVLVDGKTLYLSGRIGLIPGTTKVPDIAEEEARLALDEIKRVLAMAGMTMDHLVSLQIFCSDVSLFDQFNAVYRTYFTGKLPIESLTPSFLIFSGAFRKSRLQMGLRRASSLLLAAVGLLLSAPLMAVIAVAIAIDSRGPVFFVDRRAGRGGRPFNLVKFRTMHPLPPGETVASSVWDRDDELRVTRVGRFIRKLRLDELPQFWNVVKGDMDLVGPRPEILANVQTMSEEIPYYGLRHSVRPGLTGWAQTRFGYSVSLEQVTEKIRYDLFYIKQMSFWLDLRILVDTVKIMLFGRGAK